MKERSTYKVISSERVNMGGNLLDQPLPTSTLDQLDPFLLIHHWKDRLPGNQSQQSVGVGPHPHRGFSPVTFIFQGNIQHRDSLGNDAIVEKGGTQWMNSGRGITHSERPSAAIAEEGGNLEFIQFWVNSPAKSKLDPPFYLPISDEETPKIKHPGVEIGVVAGEYQGKTGPARILSPMTLLRLEIEAGTQLNIPLPPSFNTLIYLLDGALQFGKEKAKAKDMIVFQNDGEQVALQALEKTRFIVLSAEPLNEPIASYGPFVMNNQTQIMEALRDAQMGKMGVLIEDF